MKRSHEENQEELPIKKANFSEQQRLENPASNIGSESDSDSSSVSATEEVVNEQNSSVIDIDEQMEICRSYDSGLTQTQQDVVRSTLAALRRTNIYDWQIDDSHDWMHLREICVVHDSDDLLRECQIYIKLLVSETQTYTRIRYMVQGSDESQYICLEWNTNPQDPPLLTIQISRMERFCLVFQREQTDSVTIEVADTPDDHWCYFPDIRIHLYRISP